ncbi:tyrosine-type recombinase/integrase [Ralstonia insidiosa]|uniref:tyrosine-type recombinase/integrase n=1 Tax=Ralstonia insidiosa TaxID=190721 RepID=UPI001E2FD1A3|nr:tyrosine-type recombinase/integrase [Ralstonia insidiosa]
MPFAVETGMRRGEVLAVDWEYIDFRRRTAYIPKTKTDTPRTVPLSSKALAILQNRQDAGEGVPFAMQEGCGHHGIHACCATRQCCL